MIRSIRPCHFTVVSGELQLLSKKILNSPVETNYISALSQMFWTKLFRAPIFMISLKLCLPSKHGQLLGGKVVTFWANKIIDPLDREIINSDHPEIGSALAQRKKGKIKPTLLVTFFLCETFQLKKKRQMTDQ